MAKCVCLEACPFFNDQMSEMPTMAEVYKRTYCEGDNTQCARYRVYQQFGPGHVPEDLYPNDLIAAKRFLEGEAH